MRHPHRFEHKSSNLDSFVWFDDAKIRSFNTVLFELRLDKTGCQRSSVNRNTKLGINIRHSTDMIFVAVGNNEGANTIFVLFKIGSIADYIIDTRHISIRKLNTGINNKDVVVVLIQQHIFVASLSASTERNDS